jgi:3'-phosphoadenosine 5'-phosphosulfate (PAPS) 3'-phosphatase
VGNNTGVSRKDVPLEIHNIASIIRCCSSQLRSAASAATTATKTATVLKKNTHHDTNRISGQSVQAKNVVIINATADVFLVLTTLKQIMTELSDAVTEKGKFAVVTKAMFRLLKNNDKNSS